MIKCLIHSFPIFLILLTGCSKSIEKTENQASCTSIERASLAKDDNVAGDEINAPLELGNVPENIPDGMIYMSGGSTTIGSEKGFIYEKPTFTTEVEPFFMDKHPVTVVNFGNSLMRLTT